MLEIQPERWPKMWFYHNYFKLFEPRLATDSKFLGFPCFGVNAYKGWGCLKIYEGKRSFS